MENVRVDFASIIEHAGIPDTRGWYAWEDVMPPRPDDVHVVGEAYVSNPGVEPQLTYRQPQGINPAVLQLDLRLHQQAGIWPEVFVWKPARYRAVIGGIGYSRVVIFVGNLPIVGIDVQIVSHADTLLTAAPQAAVRVQPRDWRSENPFPRSGENPFPWSENPFPWVNLENSFCFSGTLSTVRLGNHVDNVPYLLRIQDRISVRIMAKDESVDTKLKKVADSGVTVCGHFAWSPEGYQYLVAERVEESEKFSTFMRT